MAYSKSIEYKEDEIALARFAKALGHPARIAIMKHLAAMADCCFTDILHELPIAQSTVSQHLSELKDAGLIKGNLEPPKVLYCINPENWKKAQELFHYFLNELKDGGKNSKCC
ncbi:MAG: winged helix-turn-helix transcriptional regulator [Bacteroidales bacterium]|nr:winged helix-turn-helix transcriptional regulator [Bacteroidales bacterium]